MKTSIIIPAYEEEESIGYVLDRIPNNDHYEILVVDGGSQDNTVQIAEARGAQVILEEKRGYGRACATGVENTRGEIVVFLDADGADDPSLIPKLVAPLIEGEADMALGSRLAGKIHPGAMSMHQYAGNWFAAGLIRRLYGCPITDLSPFRAVDRAKLLRLEMQEMTYGWPTEMIVKASLHGWRLQEIPVEYFPRFGGKSKISRTIKGTFLAAFYILTTIVKYGY
ncbi:MAG: glycosyltransferase family 2 protein [Anaerolineae bacterium]|nr:glycosyltransferase family 2 protein [Anaerolineae bacterium]